MTTFFLNHLKEVKLHFLLIIFLTLTFFSISFYYSDQWFYVLIYPLIQIKQSNYFIVTDLIEIFNLKLTLSFILSVIGITLIFILQVWIFLAPGLYKHENKLICQIFSIFLVGLSISITLVFFYLIPNMWCFFYDYEKTEHPFLFNLYLEPKLSNYILFLLKILGFITLFLQYPLLIFVLLQIKIITIYQLTKFRKLFYLKILIIASLIAPPDISSQLIIFVILVFFMEFMICSFFILKKNS